MKLRNKLILSCAALAAVATTAVSTTFAWYTSNTQVSAKGATAESADSGNAMLMIADGLDSSGNLVTTIANLKFASSVTITGKVVNGAGESEDLLMPAAYNGTGIQSQNEAISATTNTTNGSYLHFALWFRNSGKEAQTLTYKITKLENNGNAGVQEILKGAEGYTTLGGTDEDDYLAGMTYGVDIVKALGMVVTEKKVSVNAAKTTLVPTSTAADITTKNFDISDVATTVKTPSADLNVNAHDAAIDYYNLVMGTGKEISIEPKNATTSFGDASGDTQVTTRTVGGDETYMLMDFMVYLNGWDEQCYDACQGQTFTMDLQFDLTVE